MTGARRLGGFLMHDSWRTDVVLASRFELAGGARAAGAARRRIGDLLPAGLGEDDRRDVLVLVCELGPRRVVVSWG